MENCNVDVDYILERINFSDTIVLSKDQQSYSCGRGRNNMIVCLSLMVSRSHCMFIRTNDGLSIIDLASSNGLYINGVLQSPHTLVGLSENDIIGIGCPDVDTTNSSMFVYKLRIAKPKPSVSLPNEYNSGILSKTVVNRDNSKLSVESKANKELKSTTSENFHDKRKLSVDNGSPCLPPKLAKLQSQEASSSSMHCPVGELSDDTFENKISDVNVRKSSSKMQEDDDVQILLHYSNTLKNKESHKTESNRVNHPELMSIEKENRLDHLFEHSRNRVDTNDMEGRNVSPSFAKRNDQRSSDPINIEVPLPINRPECSKAIQRVSEQRPLFDVQFDSDNINCPVENDTRFVNVNNDKVVRTVKDRCKGELEFNCNLHNRISKTNETIFQNKKFLNKSKSLKSTKQIPVKDINLKKSNSNHEVTESNEHLQLETRNTETVLNKTSNSFQCTEIPAFNTQNTNLEEDNVCGTLTALTLKKKTEDPFEISIKMEIDSQITDSVKEITSPRLVHPELLSKSSPIKLRKIKQEPMTSYSENDIVNLSDDEDNIFPCSQLFDANVDPGREIQEDNKEQVYEEHDNNLFHGPDETEVILLSDSEGEDNPWLERLSRSQILNEDEPIIKTEKIDHDFIDLVEVNEDIFDSPIILSTSEVKKERIDDCIEERKDIKSKQKHKQEKDVPQTIRTASIDANDVAHTDPVTHEKGETNFIRHDEEHKHINKSSLCTLYHSLENNSRLENHENPFHIYTIGASINTVSDNIPCKTRFTTANIENDFIEKKEKSSLKSVSSRRVPQIIEPPFLPKGERQSIDFTKYSNVLESDVTSKTKSQLKLTAKQKKELEQRSKIEQNVNMKEQKIRRMKYKWAECLPLTNKIKSRPLPKEEKLEIINNRRAKLKKIAEEQKSTAKNMPVTKRTAAKAKAKISLKSRSDFLIKEQELLSKQCTSSNQTIPANTTTAVSTVVGHTKQLKGDCKPAASNITVKKQCSTSKKQIHVKQDLTPEISISKSVESITENLQKSLHLKKTTKITHAATNNSNVSEVYKTPDSLKICQEPKLVTTVTKNDVPIVNSSSMTISNVGNEDDNCPLNMSDGEQLRQNKKKVCFNENLSTVHTYEIDPGCSLRKVVGKDAPIPKDKLLAKRKSVPYPKLEEFLLYIFAWNPVWLEEQTHLKTDPPVVDNDVLNPMQLCYKSYEEYYKTVLPLLLLELWHQITKEFETIDKNPKRATVMCSIVNNSLTLSTIPSTNLCVTNITLEVLITKEDIQRQAHPIYGDLVFLELATIENGKQKFHKVFAYVMNVYHTTLTSHNTFYNKESVCKKSSHSIDIYGNHEATSTERASKSSTEIKIRFLLAF